MISSPIRVTPCDGCAPTREARLVVALPIAMAAATRLREVGAFRQDAATRQAVARHHLIGVHLHQAIETDTDTTGGVTLIHENGTAADRLLDAGVRPHSIGRPLLVIQRQLVVAGIARLSLMNLAGSSPHHVPQRPKRGVNHPHRASAAGESDESESERSGRDDELVQLQTQEHNRARTTVPHFIHLGATLPFMSTTLRSTGTLPPIESGGIGQISRCGTTVGTNVTTLMTLTSPSMSLWTKTVLPMPLPKASMSRPSTRPPQLMQRVRMALQPR